MANAAPVRFGILGAAAIAPAALVKPAAAHPQAAVVAVAARSAARAHTFARVHGIPHAHESYAALLDDETVDAVYVPLPNGLHGRWTIDALKAGKHVLCEKPFTANAQEAREVATLASSSDRVVMEAFHWRYHPMAVRLLELVAKGEIGRLRHVEAAVCFPLLQRNDIRWRLDLAGGALMDAGCYAVNMVRAVVGQEPEVVSAKAKLRVPGVDRYLQGDLRFPDGTTGRVTTSMLSARVLSLHVRVIGYEGTIRVFNPLMPKLFGSLRVRTARGVRIEQARRTDTYRHQLDAFTAAVTERQPFPSTADDAVCNMDVIDALYRAAGLSPRQPTDEVTT